MKQKITDYLDEIYGGTFTATHLQKLVTRLESAKRLITQRRKKHWDESDVVLITYADQFHSNDLKPLPTFNQFYHQWLQSIFSHVHLLCCHFIRGRQMMVSPLWIIIRSPVKQGSGRIFSSSVNAVI